VFGAKNVTKNRRDDTVNFDTVTKLTRSCRWFVRTRKKSL